MHKNHIASALAAVLVAGGLSAATARAQSNPSDAVELLGEGKATVQLSAAELIMPKETINYITQAEMERKTATNLWEALRGALGVNLGVSGGRGETFVNIRGSSRYQVGMYIDDIPIATAWRGEYDLNNTLIFDLESVEVSKGYSSPLLTSNNGLAGTLNVRTAAPQTEFEVKVKYRNYFDRPGADQGRLAGLTLGTKQEKFYLKATVVADDQDFFTLPSSFTDGYYQKEGRRDNSDYKNRRLALMFGLTPTEGVDLRFGLEKQRYEKGQPVTALDGLLSPLGTGMGNSTRLWRWENYDNDRYYLNANVDLTEKARLKWIVYVDQHKDTTVAYKDLKFHNPVLNDSNYGPYDQYTAGSQLRFDYTFNEANKLAVSTGYRRLSHKAYLNKYYSNNPGGLDTEAVEDYWDFGAEYSWKPIDPLTLVLGASYTRAEPKKIDYYDRNNPYVVNHAASKADLSDDLFNYQLGAFYDLTENHQLFATFAKKSRFGSMRERFYWSSNRFTSLDLSPEEAYHYEFGYRGFIDQWLKINTSVFYSDTKDKIIQSRDAGNVTYFANLNKAKTYGFELGAEAVVNEYLSLGGTFSYLKWSTESTDPTLKNLTEAPTTQGTLYAVISPLEGLSIIPQIDMTSSFYNTANPNPTYTHPNPTPPPANATSPRSPKSPGFATADLKVVYDWDEHLSFEIGAQNIFDKLYYYDWYYPQSGRTYFVGAQYTY